MRKLIACLGIALVLWPRVAAGEEPQAEIAIIRRAGAPAPFSGVLYSELAFAQQKADKEAAQKAFDLRLQAELSSQRNKLQLATATTAYALEAEKAKAAASLKSKDERIASLTSELEKAENDKPTAWRDVLWFAAGVGSVVLGAFSISAVAKTFRD